MSRKRNGVSRREFIRDAALSVGEPRRRRAARGGPRAGDGRPAQLGAQLIGKLEGPELILDPAKWPTKFSEAPMLAELVKQGKLPPVEQRSRRSRSSSSRCTRSVDTGGLGRWQPQ